MAEQLPKAVIAGVAQIAKGIESGTIKVPVGGNS